MSWDASSTMRAREERAEIQRELDAKEVQRAWDAEKPQRERERQQKKIAFHKAYRRLFFDKSYSLDISLVDRMEQDDDVYAAKTRVCREVFSIDNPVRAVRAVEELLSLHEADTSILVNWNAAHHYIANKLRPFEWDDETATPPAKVTPPPAKAKVDPVQDFVRSIAEEPNPYPYEISSQSQYAAFERARANKLMDSELVRHPVVQSVVGRFVNASGLSISREHMLAFVKDYDAKGGSFNDAASLRAHFAKYFNASAYLSAAEKAAAEENQRIENMSADDMLRAYGQNTLPETVRGTQLRASVLPRGFDPDSVQR